MPERESLVRQRSAHKVTAAQHPSKQALAPEELALLRAAHRHETDAFPPTAAVTLARQIGNRALGAHIARVPGDEDLDALLGASGAPEAAAAPAAAATAADVEQTGGAGPAPAGAVEQEEAGAPTTPTAEAPPAKTETAPPRNATGGAEDAVIATGKMPTGAFSPKKEAWPLKPGKTPGQVAEGGLKGPGAQPVSPAAAGPDRAGAPEVAGGERSPAEAAAGAAPVAGEERETPSTGGVGAAPEAGAERSPAESEAAGAAREAESQGASQAESAGQAVESEARGGEAEVEAASEAGQAEQETAPAAEEGREPSWMASARNALQRVLSFVSDHARQAMQVVNSLGTRIVSVATQGVQAATRAIRRVAATIGGFIAGLLAPLHGTIAAVVSRAQGIAREIREAAGRAVNWVLSLMGDIGARIRTGVTDFLRGAYRRLVPQVRNLRMAVERTLALVTNEVVSAVRQRGQQLREALRRIVMQIVARIRALRDRIREAVDSLLNGEPPAPQAAARWVRERLRRLSSPALRAVGEALTRATAAGLRGVRGALRAIVEPIGDAYRSTRALLRIGILPVVEGAREYAPEIVQEAEIAGSQGETAAQTVNTSIESELMSTEATTQDGAATVAAEINAVVES